MATDVPSIGFRAANLVGAAVREETTGSAPLAKERYNRQGK